MEPLLSSNDATKASKWRKKANKGEINSIDNYAECLRYRVNGKPILSLCKGTKGDAKHDLNITDLRELLAYSSSIKASSKLFKLGNRPFLGFILHIHFTDISDTFHVVPPTSSSGICHSLKLKVTNSTTKALCLPQRLLSMNYEELEQLGLHTINSNDTSSCTSENNSQLDHDETVTDIEMKKLKISEKKYMNMVKPYIISESALYTWGYPVPYEQFYHLLQQPSSSMQSNDYNTNNNENISTCKSQSISVTIHNDNKKAERIAEISENSQYITSTSHDDDDIQPYKKHRTDETKIPVVTIHTPLIGVMSGHNYIPNVKDAEIISKHLTSYRVIYENHIDENYWATHDPICNLSHSTSSNTTTTTNMTTEAVTTTSITTADHSTNTTTTTTTARSNNIEIGVVETNNDVPTSDIIADRNTNTHLLSQTITSTSMEHNAMIHASSISLWYMSSVNQQQPQPQPPHIKSISSHNILALDCEMCETAQGDEVTRVTICNHNNEIILDSFVKPSAPIIDYRTQYSGINESLLQGVNVTLSQIRIAVLRIVTADSILIGHSLDNDLKALKICHMRNIDTTILYPHPRGYPLRMKLKTLAEKYLGMKIQLKQDGHNSADDCLAAMKLTLLKAKKGPKFGLYSDNDDDGIDTNRQPLLHFLSPDYISSSLFLVSTQNDVNLIRNCIPKSTNYTLLKDIETSNQSLLEHIQSYYQHHYEKYQEQDKLLLPHKGVHLIHASIPYISNEKSTTILKSICDTISPYTSNHHTLMVVTGQTNHSDIVKLIKMKRACSNIQACATWSYQQEEKLRTLLSAHHMCPVSIWIE